MRRKKLYIKEKDQMFNKKNLRRASNINSALLILFFLLTLTVLLAEPLATLIVGKDSADYESLRYLIGFLLQYLIGIGVPLLLFRLSKDGKEIAAEKKPLFAKPKMSWGWIIKHMVIAYFFIYATSIISSILVSLLQLALGIELNPVTLQVSEGILSKVAAIVGAMILAPLFEELFFRGAMLRNASRYGKWSAIIAMGIFFGLWHMNYPQTLFAVAMGIYSGFIAVKTGSIIPSIILHFVMNTLGTMMNIVVAGLDMEKLEAADMTYIMEKSGVFAILGVYFLLIFGLMIAGLVLFIIEMVKHRDSYSLDTVKEEGEPSEGKKLGIYFTAPITIIAVVFYIGLTVANALVAA